MPIETYITRYFPPIYGVRARAVNCTNCGAPMRVEEDRDYLVCDFCGSTHLPEADAEGVRMLGEVDRSECPVCHVALVHAAVSGCRLLFCGRCRGFLVTVDTFMGLVSALRSRQSAGDPAPVRWKDLGRHIRCPRCFRHMDTHPYAGPGNVIIDNCPHCRLNWLDHMELIRIATSPERRYNEDAWATQ
ncbi:MAG: zf-TFIIB domain-containing protein [Bryobacteraceae bacterium]